MENIDRVDPQNGPLNKEENHLNGSSDSRDPAYFSYYALLTHQQNMLQDTVRTSTYRHAILANSASCFHDKIILDVGAGSGILSFFAVQAGAQHVYAVEASDVAFRLQKIVDEANLSYEGNRTRNSFLKDKVTVIHSKIEKLPVNIPRVDTIISEPIGVFLIHERMLESFIYARDQFLKPGGTLFPSSGIIHIAPFTDANLYIETITKARFWEQTQFYGVNLSVLSNDALDEIFGMPVVGSFDYRSLIGSSLRSTHIVNFSTVSISELLTFDIPITCMARYTGLIHGLAGWFDLSFEPPSSSTSTSSSSGQIVTMTTSPNAERTHWQQVRFLFKEPLAVNCGEKIQGIMRCTVNNQRSYLIQAEISTEELIFDGKFSTTSLPRHPNRRIGKWQLHEQTYNYTYSGWSTSENSVKPEHHGLYEPFNFRGINEEIVLEMDQT